MSSQHSQSTQSDHVPSDPGLTSPSANQAPHQPAKRPKWAFYDFDDEEEPKKKPQRKTRATSLGKPKSSKRAKPCSGIVMETA
jgi:hypothetical protein